MLDKLILSHGERNCINDTGVVMYNSDNMQAKPGEKDPIVISEARKIKHAITCQHLMTCDKIYCYLACPKWETSERK
jgi:hypothetical protein